MTPKYFLLASPKRPKAGPPFLKKERSALNELVQADISILKRPNTSRLYTVYLEYLHVGDTPLMALCSSYTLAALVAELRDRAVAGEPQESLNR